MSVGIVLVHGYTGSPEDLEPLAQQLSVNYNSGSVTNVCLPGHCAENIPHFNKQQFTDCIASAVEHYIKEKRPIIILGHSTGGILALSFLLEHSFAPHLLILAGAPKKIDAGYMDRWNSHRSGKENIPFNSVAEMVSLINFTGSRQFKGVFPVLVMHGEHDSLVLPEEAFAWKQKSFDGPIRTALIPSAGHDIFRGTNNKLAIDIVVRAVSDAVTPQKKEDAEIIKTLLSVEQEANNFLTLSPSSGIHLSQCPSVQMLAAGKPLLSPVVKTEPVFANIEITTRCNLHCKYCARSIMGRQGEDMPKEMFSRILDLLPHAYRVTIVGLGEPLLHPHITDFVANASSRGRRVAVATNAMCLDKSLARGLIKAGLHSIVFSIDSSNQDLASDVRPGTDLNRVFDNIKTFMEISASTRPISTAVFSAVSIKTVPYLEQLVDDVKNLGVNVLMLSDLNFKQNVMDTVWKNANDQTVAIIRKAVAAAFSKKLPVLSVHGLEEFGLARRYRDFLLMPPDKLCRRSAKHAWCFSPWQTVPVDVNGNVTICDCQPENIVGNLLARPLSEIWNSKTMVEYRKRMTGANPPEACSICPRF